MKGFPNQIADISKLTAAYALFTERIDAGEPIDDDSFGEVLLRNEIIKFRGQESIDDYLKRMREKSPSNQSHRSAARGLKEFFRLAQLIQVHEDVIVTTGVGTPLLEAYYQGDDGQSRDAWRLIARGIQAYGPNGEVSHPYQVLLRLMAARPGMGRSRAPLALEALDDSDQEIERIVALCDIEDEAALRQQLGVSKANWENAKKILPSIAGQLGDAIQSSDGLHTAGSGPTTATGHSNQPTAGSSVNARRVTVETIAASKGPSDSDEGLDLDSAENVEAHSLAEAIAKRADRSSRHNALVQDFASIIPAPLDLWEGDIDCLAEIENVVLLAEMKTLDGSAPDEVRQVRHAVGQIQYYEQFSIPTEVRDSLEAGKELIKVAVFEAKPSDAHIEWMQKLGIEPIWQSGSGFVGTNSTRERLANSMGSEFLEPSVG